MHVDNRTAAQAMVRLAHDVDLEFLREATKAGPLFTYMYHARSEAIAALVNLVSVDPANAEDVRKLQNEVQRFIDAVTFCKNVLKEGYEAAVALREEDAEELRDLIGEEHGAGADA